AFDWVLWVSSIAEGLVLAPFHQSSGLVGNGVHSSQVVGVKILRALGHRDSVLLRTLHLCDWGSACVNIKDVRHLALVAGTLIVKTAGVKRLVSVDVAFEYPPVKGVVLETQQGSAGNRSWQIKAGVLHGPTWASPLVSLQVIGIGVGVVAIVGTRHGV